MTNDIIEAAARALHEWHDDYKKCHDAAEHVVAVITPMIRAQALEEAAVVTEEFDLPVVSLQIAAAIRTLKTVDKSDERT